MSDCERCLSNRHIAHVVEARISALSAVMRQLETQISHLSDLHEDLMLGVQP